MKTIAVLSLALLSPGCALLGLSPKPMQADQVKRLLARPDFAPAAQAAPAWVKDALDTVNAQQLRLDNSK